MGHTLSQHLGFNPTRQIACDLNPETEAQLEELEPLVPGIANDYHPLPTAPDPELSRRLTDPELRVATLDEIRQVALDRIFKASKSLVRREARKDDGKSPRREI